MTVERTLSVATEAHTYPIILGRGLLDDADEFSFLSGRPLVVVSNATVAPLYLERLRRSLPTAPLLEVILPDGEQHKTIDTWQRVHEQLANVPVTRDAVLLALGGGVIGDLCGFVAASYMRGVDFVQIPTTLLAQVDASVGGKTAVNLRAGKNLVGAFHQPVRVIMDLETLTTLPARERAAGWAELIKTALIRDPELWSAIRRHDTPEAPTSALIARAVTNKAEIVAADEKEQGVRALLNLGHTFGHALEAATDYAAYLHGEAVAIGLLAAADLSQRLGMLDSDVKPQLAKTLLQYGLPTSFDGVPAQRLLDLMAADKKAVHGKLRFVLLNAIGDACLRDDVPSTSVLETLVACGAAG